MASALQELSPECNEVRPPEPARVPFTERDPERQAAALARIKANPKISVQVVPSRIPEFTGAAPLQWEMLYNFDTDRGNGPSLQALVALVQAAARENASAIEVHGYRGTSKLDNGEILVEPPGVAQRRAQKIAGIIAGLGFPAAKIETRWTEELAPPDGHSDWRKRRVTVEVQRGASP